MSRPRGKEDWKENKDGLEQIPAGLNFINCFAPNAELLRHKKASQKLGVERKWFHVGHEPVYEIETLKVWLSS